MPDDLASATRHVAHLRDHFSAHPDWTPGRRFYTWFLTFEHRPEAHRLAHTYQAQLLQLPHLDLVPLEWLHLTIQVVGDAKEVSPKQARLVACRAADELAALEPFAITLGPARVAAEAVMLDVGPPEPFRAVHQALRRAITSVRGAELVPTAPRPLVPHVSLAYSNTSQPAEPLIRATEAVSARPVLLTVTNVQLVLLRRQGHSYRWSAFARVPVGELSTRSEEQQKSGTQQPPVQSGP